VTSEASLPRLNVPSLTFRVMNVIFIYNLMQNSYSKMQALLWSIKEPSLPAKKSMHSGVGSTAVFDLLQGKEGRYTVYTN
jgi:hypothetical protein